jgi:hypothetical protein
MQASVPELVKRTISTEGTAAMTALASSFSRGQGAPKEVPVCLEMNTNEISSNITHCALHCHSQ